MEPGDCYDIESFVHDSLTTIANEETIFQDLFRTSEANSGFFIQMLQNLKKLLMKYLLGTDSG